MISKSISLDEKVNSLSDDTARLLFTWLIPHLDCEGRLHGDAITIKSIVFPRRNISARKVEKYLKEMENLELILRYSVNGNTYLCAPNFEKHQTGLQKNKESQSQIPPSTPELLQSKDREGHLQDKVKDKVKEEVEVKDKEDTSSIANRNDPETDNETKTPDVITKEPKPTMNKRKLDNPILQEVLKVESWLETTGRKYESPRFAAERKAIAAMVKLGFGADQICACWQDFKKERFYQTRELLMMKVEGEIQNWATRVKKKDTFKSRYGHLVMR